MRRAVLSVCGVAACLLTVGLEAQWRPSSRPVAYDAARVIVGDGAVIAPATFVVQDGRFIAVGLKGSVAIPAGATRVDLSGRTVMPALVNAHVHIGYEGYTSWGTSNYTPANVLDHLRREAYYGVAATQSVGSSPTEASIQFVTDQQAGKFPAASRFFFMPGMAPPGGGPDAILIKATNELKVVYEVTIGAQARAAVQGMRAKGIMQVKIWVDDRRGTYPKMTPEVYNAVIDEAHKNGMLVHTVQNEPIDDEWMALLREKKPYWTTVIGLGDRSEACDGDPFVDQTYPQETLHEIHEKDCAPRPAEANATRERNLANNMPKYLAAGARLVLGTDAGLDARHAFGWADHHELSRWVQSGVPIGEAIIAATSRAAQLLGATDLGSMAVGKSADFLVLTANPLEDIRNTRRIDNVFLRGVALDRAKMAREFRGKP